MIWIWCVVRYIVCSGTEGIIYMQHVRFSRHMKEISELVKGFDDRIELISRTYFMSRFGKENGKTDFREVFYRCQSGTAV